MEPQPLGALAGAAAEENAQLDESGVDGDEEKTELVWDGAEKPL